MEVRRSLVVLYWRYCVDLCLAGQRPMQDAASITPKPNRTRSHFMRCISHQRTWLLGSTRRSNGLHEVTVWLYGIARDSTSVSSEVRCACPTFPTLITDCGTNTYFSASSIINIPLQVCRIWFITFLIPLVCGNRRRPGWRPISLSCIPHVLMNKGVLE
ncbi:hypothetical protein EDB89DRAFT_116162 [Lactarius sanguifluus]|nr:hypothetical protein EDB89DRAFT_116162 [Lactarius sanguifluus]